jgi:hypothetical protein
VLGLLGYNLESKNQQETEKRIDNSPALFVIFHANVNCGEFTGKLVAMFIF